MSNLHEIIVISDLHIGGVHGPDGGRGFRMNTRVAELAAFVRSLAAPCGPGGAQDRELVINGDIVDFLAERDDEDAPWDAFVADERVAERRFGAIVAREPELFEAVGEFVAAGHKLTLLLGNHDLELSLPRVRRSLLKSIGADHKGRVEFLYDGEAYQVGDALIEHGNRYDGFNIVAHDKLRRLRSLLSRGLHAEANGRFQAPPGSRLVAEIMNRMKQSYAFVDLLKPETEAVTPILLALDPSIRAHLRALLSLYREAHRDRPRGATVVDDVKISATLDEARARTLEAEVQAALAANLEAAEANFNAVAAELDLTDARADDKPDTRPDADRVPIGLSLEGAAAIAKLLLAKRGAAAEADDAWRARLPALYRALRGLRGHETFNLERDTDAAYKTAAEVLTAKDERGEQPIRVVVFGHTHLARRIKLDSGGIYINSGTWVDLIPFPGSIFQGDKATAIEKLDELVTDLRAGKLDRWLWFRPTYARLLVDVEEGRTVEAELHVHPSEKRGAKVDIE